MEIFKLLSHSILIEDEKIVENKIENEEAKDFFNKVINEILEKDTKKSYKIGSLTTEVVSIIMNVLKENYPYEILENISKRLLKVEIEAQKNIDKLKIKIKKGCLVQAYIKKDEKKYFIITKIEATDGLDMEELKIREILPFQKKILKNALFEINEENEIENIFLSDTNGDISKYWYNDFLEIKEMTTDEVNTEKTYNIIMKEIDKGLKEVSPPDYIFCRNKCIGFFKTKEFFDFNEAMSEIFMSYEFENQEIEKEKIVKKIHEKISKINLDTQFTLKKEVIKNRKIKFRESVNQGISIEIEGFLEDIKNNIYSQKRNEDKYIIIKATEEAYKLFDWEKLK
jgi:hypothetical protein